VSLCKISLDVKKGKCPVLHTTECDNLNKQISVIALPKKDEPAKEEEDHDKKKGHGVVDSMKSGLHRA